MSAAAVVGLIAAIFAAVFGGWRWERARRQALEIDRDRVAQAAAQHLGALRDATLQLQNEAERQRMIVDIKERAEAERDAIQAAAQAARLNAAEAAARLDAAADAGATAAAAALNAAEGLE